MRFHLLPSFRKTPKPAQLSAPAAHEDPVKEAEADKRASDEALRTLLELKTFFDANEQPTGRVLCSRGNAVGVFNERRQDSNAHLTGRRRQSPVTPVEFSRKLLGAVNHIEDKAQTADKIGEHEKGLVEATESVKVLMNKSSFEDTPTFRAAVNKLWDLHSLAKA
jgi:hypothetical protein